MKTFEIQTTDDDNAHREVVTNVRQCAFNFVSRIRSSFRFMFRFVFNENGSESNQDVQANYDSTHESLVDIAMQENRI